MTCLWGRMLAVGRKELPGPCGIRSFQVWKGQPFGLFSLKLCPG